MPLPDFLAFEPFNLLRQQMGATELGQFEFFDPKKHISGDEKLQLQTGLGVDKGQLLELLDYTLAYKNSRVLISVWEPVSGDDWVYHLATCEKFPQLPTEIRATTQRPQHGFGSFNVCVECLQRLRYKGFDAVRNRHRHYSQRLHDDFNLEEFFRQYPTYPLTYNDDLSLIL